MFDEIEKAAPDVLNLLLQVMDDGRLTDAQGRLCDFKNTVIIMTSNVGSEQILEGKSDQINEILHRTFKPEFLNRIDEIVYFNNLSKDVQYKIVTKMLNDLKLRLSNEYYNVEFTSNVNEWVLQEAYSPEFGARPLKRFIQHEVETQLARMIIGEELKPNLFYTVDYDKNTKQIVVKLTKDFKK